MEKNYTYSNGNYHIKYDNQYSNLTIGNLKKTRAS